ncbi:hypothetical protein GUITHDRAFT_153131 [Guillardia theta CCMP2712]|uniref:Uncharacterized protein n=1 Tax=Guillardia theta (strain CCMP2712) TaxID=905079 RepID=L1J647_GUITC|nr:hypothetical protein GUITHDRAFT_153131 [Guillardia theta CCMP2712]EKX44018.1 hypothetical protein GUITHDRAFT_153131 [Guillardia theta CCMP2712]|eukprot:XP_005830998.1 hypothetical protein GUITHDRAFT_153131 [Guillardia theta CCMP2712]
MRDASLCWGLISTHEGLAVVSMRVILSSRPIAHVSLALPQRFRLAGGGAGPPLLTELSCK